VQKFGARIVPKRFTRTAPGGWRAGDTIESLLTPWGIVEDWRTILRVLITGANGFVGKTLAEDMTQAGWYVRGAVRRDSAVQELPPGVEPALVTTPLAKSAWRESVHSMDVVIHLIGRTHHTADSGLHDIDSYRQTNVDVTRGLYAASLESSPKRFIYVSSVKAVGEGGVGARYSEFTECQPQDAYGITKREAEIWLATKARESGLDTTILRPPMIYGPRVQANFLRLLDLVARGYPLPFGSLTNARSILYVKNLSAALLAVATNTKAITRTFFVADALPLSTKELTRSLAELMGKRPFLFPFPTNVLEWAGRITGHGGEVAKLVTSLVVDTDPIRNEIGWTPPYTTHEGLAATTASYLADRNRGRL
jgi:UDP-N-acetyl-alpha-D-quinovosamine dehydrogenase